jgi:hypothetical protein
MLAGVPEAYFQMGQRYLVGSGVTKKMAMSPGSVGTRSHMTQVAAKSGAGCTVVRVYAVGKLDAGDGARSLRQGLAAVRFSATNQLANLIVQPRVGQGQLFTTAGRCARTRNFSLLLGGRRPQQSPHDDTNVLRAELEMMREPVAAARGVKATKAKSTVAAQFKNPETGETWTGRGHAPRWLEGKDRNAYRIKG